jgi:cytochrome oxidase Cu insertion factor (SCO1/SenC/PrrC family)
VHRFGSVGLAGAAALLAVLSACSSSTSMSPSTGSSPSASAFSTPTAGTAFDKAPSPTVVALPFENQYGQTVTLDSLKGQTVVLTDFLSLCQEICPLTAGNFEQIAEKVKIAGASSKITLLEVTVDPARDTATRLKAYSRNLGAPVNWQFWTGSPANIAALWKEMGVFYEKVGEDPGVHPIDWWTGKGLTYDVDHQDVVFVLGADGHEKWLIQGNPNLQGGSVPAFLVHFLNGNAQAKLASPGAQSWTSSDVTTALTYVTGQQIG